MLLRRLTSLVARHFRIGFLSLSDQVLTIGAPFLINIALARYLTQADYGIFTLIYTILVFVSGIHNAIIGEPLFVYSSGRYRAVLPSYRSLGLWLSVGTTLSIDLILLAGYWGTKWWRPAMANTSLLAMAVSLNFILAASFIKQISYAAGQVRQAALMSLSYAAVLAIGLTALLWQHGLNASRAFLLLGMGWVPALVVMLCRWHPSFRSARDFLRNNRGYAFQHWQYTRWVLATAVVFQMVSHAYLWLIAGMMSTTAVAEFRAAGNLLRPVDLIFLALSMLVLPRMAEHFNQQRYTGLYRMLRQFTALMVLVTSTFGFTILVLGKSAIHLLYSGKYDGATMLLVPMLCSSMIMGIGNSYNTALKAAEYPNVVFYAYSGAGVITLTVGVLLIQRWGLMGAVLGMIASSTAYAIILYFGFRYIVRKRYPDSHLAQTQRTSAVG